MPVLKDCNIWFGGYDLTSVANELTIETMYADVDVTTFGSAGSHTRVGGLQDSNISLMTFLDPSVSEPAFFGDRGGVVRSTTVQRPLAQGCSWSAVRLADALGAAGAWRG